MDNNQQYVVRIYLKSGDVFCTEPASMVEAADYLIKYKTLARTIEFRDLDENNSFGYTNRIIVSFENISYVAIENITKQNDSEDNT